MQAVYCCHGYLSLVVVDGTVFGQPGRNLAQPFHPAPVIAVGVGDLSPRDIDHTVD
jgi:hypothetical protein